ncbi:hypothetical protein GGQ74_003094 [Desulfobaculum xiamenense]|uniref:DUF3108 domain-containing protein n=1 Tax=Desulfobaculum xiamenense TaxID=995050 RepID=A0A846QS80_9BACT|nr:DUF3108 domain-containing protein [Desulfobaculum xiamenense]NJB69392.1 hypothetical protein [Desulfobaculum xiamenense]
MPWSRCAGFARCLACACAVALVAALWLVPCARAGDCGGVSERLEFYLHWGPLPVGSATLETSAVDGVCGGCRVTLQARSNALADMFAKVRDRVESESRDGFARSCRYARQVREGRVQSGFETWFDVEGTGSVRHDENGDVTRREDVGAVSDPLAVLYLLRRAVGGGGDVFGARVSDGLRDDDMAVVRMGRERIRTRGGWRDAELFAVRMAGLDGPFVPWGDGEWLIWASGDQLRLPLRIRVQAVVAGFAGHFTAELVRVERLGRAQPF